jgi:hypothetical protein
MVRKDKLRPVKLCKIGKLLLLAKFVTYVRKYRGVFDERCAVNGVDAVNERNLVDRRVSHVLQHVRKSAPLVYCPRTLT